MLQHPHPHLRVVQDRELDRDRAVVAHARALEAGLGGSVAMDRALDVAGVDDVVAELEQLRDQVSDLLAELEQLRALRDTVAQAVAS